MLTPKTFQGGRTLRAQAAVKDISKACRVLFGTEVPVTTDFLRHLQLTDLKDSYHRKALEFHPDRAHVVGKDVRVMNEMFKDVSLAYECLKNYLDGRLIPFDPDERPRNTSRPASRPRNRAGRHTRERSEAGPRPDSSREDFDHYWEARIPEIRLLFGQFLYYAGVISWKTLITAITWQRRQRPPFGKIAVMWDYLDRRDVEAIVAGRIVGEKIGDSALRLGLLTPFQRNAVLGFQRWLQRPIGSYFSENGLLTEDEIVSLIRLLKRHNTRVNGRGRMP